MYAVIENGGKQYRVAVGDKLRLERMEVEPGAELALDHV
ncbi:MAG TPA: bL21 family ribosomal protein, partial [Acidithiobacillus sp.]|nr:bL21 family ribosomal protein [Acidithiobacillus sp.]